MVNVLKKIKQFTCRYINKECGVEVVGQRQEKPTRLVSFHCGKCDRIISSEIQLK